MSIILKMAEETCKHATTVEELKPLLIQLAIEIERLWEREVERSAQRLAKPERTLLDV